MVTPNMDALAAASLMQFDQAYTQQAVCLPARISLLHGDATELNRCTICKRISVRRFHVV